MLASPRGSEESPSRLIVDHRRLRTHGIQQITFDHRHIATNNWLVLSDVTASIRLSCQLTLTHILTRPPMRRAEPVTMIGAKLEKIRITNSTKASKLNQSSFVFEKQQYLGIIYTQGPAT